MVFYVVSWLKVGRSLGTVLRSCSSTLVARSVGMKLFLVLTLALSASVSATKYHVGKSDQTAGAFVSKVLSLNKKQAEVVEDFRFFKA